MEIFSSRWSQTSSLDAGTGSNHPVAGTAKKEESSCSGSADKPLLHPWCCSFAAGLASGSHAMLPVGRPTTPSTLGWLNSYSSLAAFREIIAYNLLCTSFSWFAITLCSRYLTFLKDGNWGAGVSLMALPSSNCL